MTHRNLQFGLLAVCLVAVLVAGCNRAPSRIAMAGIDPSGAAAAALAEFDTNKDGAISGAELDKCPSLKSAMKTIDKNGDGKITADEITARINEWISAKTAVQQLTCTVKLNGQPLKNAKVTLVPEKFLGGDLKPAVGTTNEYGMASLSVENAPLPGVQTGLYRVQISANVGGKELIPAKYNTQTTLGQEVAMGVESIRIGVVYNVTSN
ncbi:MAG: hypothetical protein ACYC35_03665 [Pirellulales bacterium]